MFLITDMSFHYSGYVGPAAVWPSLTNVLSSRLERRLSSLIKDVVTEPLLRGMPRFQGPISGPLPYATNDCATFEDVEIFDK
jgi:hypothetical protein